MQSFIKLFQTLTTFSNVKHDQQMNFNISL